MKNLAIFALLLLFAPQASAQAPRVFSGVPSLKISEGGVERMPQVLGRAEAANLACVVSQIGGRYYWASRENKEMVRHGGGAFVTYVAVDGAGYVRVIVPALKSAASAMSPTEESFDYVEHVLIGLRSNTYYSSAR